MLIFAGDPGRVDASRYATDVFLIDEVLENVGVHDETLCLKFG